MAEAGVCFLSETMRKNSADGTSSDYYETHWSDIYEKNSNNETACEWHTAYEKIRAFLTPYISATANFNSGDRKKRIVDIGCGGSSFGNKILQEYGDSFDRLTLIDISPEIVRIVAERHATDKRIDVCIGDCRFLESIIESDCIDIIIDKGTLDALVGNEDKRAMMKECYRILEKRGGKGLIVSVSFGSVERIRLIEEICAELGLQWKIKIVADGDPREGFKTNFVFLLGLDLDTHVVEVEKDTLTGIVMDRIRRTGSMFVEEEDGVSAADLFGTEDVE